MTGRPRIAFIDIETAPILAAIWQLHEANAIWVERDTYLLCFSVLWAGSKRVKTYCLPDYPTYKKNPHDDLELCHDLWTVLNDADFVVAHNGVSFDIKKINARLVTHNLRPPSPFKTIDTLRLARQTFKFDSNKLDNLGRYLGLGRKLPTTGAHLWRGCLSGDKKAWAKMALYNAQDVRLLEKVHKRIIPFTSKYPDLRPYSSHGGCPICLSHKIQRRGISVARSRHYQRYHCQSCGHWFSGERCKTI